MLRDFIFGVSAFSVGCVVAISVWMYSDGVRSVVWYFLNKWGS